MANAVNRYFEGLLVGGALGFVAGILTAPKRGAELRKDLVDSYEDLMRQANEQLGDVKGNISGKVQPLIEQATEKVQPIMDRANEKVQTLVNKASSQLEDGKDLVNNYMGNNSGPMYTAGARASTTQAGSSVSDACSNYSANKPEAAGS